MRRSTLLRWLLVFCYCMVVFILSSNASPMAFPKIDHADKMVHFAAFVLLGILVFRACRSPGLLLAPIPAIVMTLVSSTVFGILIEIHQYYLPYRKAEALDVAADVAGCVFGVFMCLMMIRARKG